MSEKKEPAAAPFVGPKIETSNSEKVKVPNLVFNKTTIHHGVIVPKVVVTHTREVVKVPKLVVTYEYATLQRGPQGELVIVTTRQEDTEKAPGEPLFGRAEAEHRPRKTGA